MEQHSKDSPCKDLLSVFFDSLPELMDALAAFELLPSNQSKKGAPVTELSTAVNHLVERLRKSDARLKEELAKLKKETEEIKPKLWAAKGALYMGWIRNLESLKRKLRANNDAKVDVKQLFLDTMKAMNNCYQTFEVTCNELLKKVADKKKRNRLLSVCLFKSSAFLGLVLAGCVVVFVLHIVPAVPIALGIPVLCIVGTVALAAFGLGLTAFAKAISSWFLSRQLEDDAAVIKKELDFAQNFATDVNETLLVPEEEQASLEDIIKNLKDYLKEMRQIQKSIPEVNASSCGGK